MKYLVFIVGLLIFVSQSQSQNKFPKTRDKAITTAIDTLKVGGPPLTLVHVSITNIGKTDTLLWRTNYESAWSYLLPKQAWRDWIYADTIFRKSSGATGMYSQLEVR